MDTGIEISLRTMAPRGSAIAKCLAVIGPVLDHLLGISGINDVYQRGRLAGLSTFEFATKALKTLGVSACPTGTGLDERLPKHGGVLIVCNHPYGGIEALVLLSALKSVRSDVKLLGNLALRIFPELEPRLIATNPLKITQKNLTSIRQCEAFLEQGGVLIIFPAGKVSYYQKEKSRITDGRWNRIVGHLAKRTEAQLLPIFFHGMNSPLFHRMGQLWDRSKLFMLPRELLKLKGRQVSYTVGRAVGPGVWRNLDVRTLTDYARVLTYVQETRDRQNTSTHSNEVLSSLQPLAPKGDAQRMCRELEMLPERQKLLGFKQHSVYYASAEQIPELMTEIARERERVFREYDEGSGQALDSDKFDKTYVQLFVWDYSTSSLVGAYRMGRTDRLRRDSGMSGLYLSQMFDFEESFHDQNSPALELGRSFIVPEHQKSYSALYLLWQGIGRYVIAHPQYRRLYGTVSLSRQYDDYAMALLCRAVIQQHPGVRARHALNMEVHPEAGEFLGSSSGMELKTIAALVRALDAQGKDLPVLLKHYMKLGAKFVCVGVDPNFNDTPGLLLSVDVPKLAPKALSTFFGAEVKNYLAYTPDKTLEHCPVALSRCN